MLFFAYRYRFWSAKQSSTDGKKLKVFAKFQAANWGEISWRWLEWLAYFNLCGDDFLNLDRAQTWLLWRRYCGGIKADWRYHQSAWFGWRCQGFVVQWVCADHVDYVVLIGFRQTGWRAPHVPFVWGEYWLLDIPLFAFAVVATATLLIFLTEWTGWQAGCSVLALGRLVWLLYCKQHVVGDSAFTAVGVPLSYLVQHLPSLIFHVWCWKFCFTARVWALWQCWPTTPASRLACYFVIGGSSSTQIVKKLFKRRFSYLRRSHHLRRLVGQKLKWRCASGSLAAWMAFIGRMLPLGVILRNSVAKTRQSIAQPVQSPADTRLCFFIWDFVATWADC